MAIETLVITHYLAVAARMVSQLIMVILLLACAFYPYIPFNVPEPISDQQYNLPPGLYNAAMLALPWNFKGGAHRLVHEYFGAWAWLGPILGV